MKRAFYTGDRFSPTKTIITAAITVTVGAVLSWAVWVTKRADCANDAKKKIDHQTTVLHNRITQQESARAEAVKMLGDKIDKNQQMQMQQYQSIMQQLLEIQREMHRSP